MALLAETLAGSYARRRMPRPAYGDGPWGEAIRYWLAVRKIRQADLVRLVRELDPKDTTTPNTISNATRGFPTTTRILDKIARALKVPIDVVLVSPERKLANEDRRRLALEISETVLRTLESRPLPLPTDPTPDEIDHAMKVIQRSIEVEAAQVEARHDTLSKSHKDAPAKGRNIKKR